MAKNSRSILLHLYFINLYTRCRHFTRSWGKEKLVDVEAAQIYRDDVTGNNFMKEKMIANREKDA